jgi:hypothetical protein
MKCQLPNRNERMDDFLMGKLSQKEADEYEIHLFGCAECLEEVRIREEAVKLIKQERESLIADYIKDKSTNQRGAFTISLSDIFERWSGAWVYAGAAVAVAVIALIAWQLLQKEETGEQYAGSFKPSVRLESLLQQGQRSSSISIAVISPKNSESIENEVFFKWDIQENEGETTGALDLKIMDNQETPIFGKRLEQWEFNLKDNLKPGLYYWTIERQGETLYLGKFFIRNPAK